ncbi:hypothetical protein BH20ACT10_BH20ACT10_08140 [soil metagenome]
MTRNPVASLRLLAGGCWLVEKTENEVERGGHAGKLA